MRWIRVLAGLAFVLGVTACWQRTADRPAEPPPPGAAAAPTLEGLEARQQALGYLRSTGSVEQARMASAAVAPQRSAPATAERAGDPLDALWEQQKLIRDGRIEVEVESVDATVERIGRVAGERRALVAGSEVRKGADGRKSGTVTLRVPAGAFDATVADLREIGKVRAESTSTQDVTKAYTDLEARLEVKNRTRERLEALMATRSGSLSDLLQVERELERVVTEIERMEGEKRYYDQRVAVSTITVVLFEPGSVAPGPGAFEPVREAVRDALTVLARSIAALVYLVTSALPWVLLVWLLWAVVRRLRRRRAARATGDSGTG